MNKQLTIAAVDDSFYELLQQTACEAYIKALSDIPPDVREGLRSAIAHETEPRATQVMRTMLDAVELGDQGMIVCQDTGIPIYWFRIGTARFIDGARIAAVVESGVREATLKTPFRSSIVHPITRVNRQDSTGVGVPILHFDFVADADYLDMMMMPKGSGSENWTSLKMLVPADGEPGIRRFILQSVVDAGGKACPPLVVGIGLGGSSDQCVALAKFATTRPIGRRNEDERLAAFELQLLEEINSLGIGPQGLGGATTALDVHIERAWTHNSMNPIAVNMQCWRGERRTARLYYADGLVEWGYSW